MTRFFLILTVLCAVPVFAADNSTPPAASTPATSTQAAKAPAKKDPPLMPPHLTIPKDAKPEGNGKFDYTDAKGQRWVYWNTPLGVARSMVDDSYTPAEKSASSSSTKVTDTGDSIRFETSTPLGTNVVVKKKTELSEQEQAFVKTRLAEEATEAAHFGSHE